ncbi:LysM peptidoglycan-binding domain-containing protein [Microcoleus sp. AT3-D2]|uniref:LysM peptidoglycan-binding domain-containing protein n=1 Tax=Microcoleus sp. AT3-D2 TaxID=2818612 RepID=UPI002FD62652
MSLKEINPANSLKTGVDSFTGLPGSISDINRDLFGESLSKAPSSVLGGIPMNPLLESEDDFDTRATYDRSISAIQTKAWSGASSVYGDESGIFPINRTAQQVGKALMDNPITAPVPSGDRVDRPGQYDELTNPNPSNLATTVLSGDTLWEIAQKGLGTGSRWRELQKADGNGFTEREAYKLPNEKSYKRHVIKLGDTLWSIAKEELGVGDLWRTLRTKDDKPFKDEDIRKLEIGTEVYVPINVNKNKEKGTSLSDRWINYLKYCQSKKGDKVFGERRWVHAEDKKDESGKVIGRKGVGVKFDKQYYTLDNGNSRERPYKSSRKLDIVWIKKTGDVIGFEIKGSEEAANSLESQDQKSRDQQALDDGHKIREPGNPKELHKPTKVIRIYDKEPPKECKEDLIEYLEKEGLIDETNLPKKAPSPVGSKEDPGVEVEPPNIDSPPQPQDYRSPVGSEKDSEEDPEVDVERRKPKPRNINPPRFNVPARPPAIESPKPIDDAPARPRTEPPLDAPARPRTEPPLDAPARPSARPPIDDDPARPPVRPPASTTVLNTASRVARPLAVVTDVIDLTNAYNEDGGFGENFQETAGKVAGEVVGTAAGAAVGSLLGPVGTVLGGAAGGFLGGIAGEGIVKGIRGLFG